MMEKMSTEHASPTSSNVRHSVIAGSWYPGDPRQLRAMIDDFLAEVPEQPLQGDLIGLIAPHAGYVYSGQVAAYAYAPLRDRSFRRVVVVSPVHRMYAGRFAVTDKAYYETPFGLVAVDGDMIGRVERHVRLSRVSSDMEHSLEIQLPFLQHVLGDFQLTPLMMGDQDWGSIVELGQAMAEVTAGYGSGEVLLVASTDLSHFHRYDMAVELDQRVLDRITAYDPEGLATELATHKCEACGGGPVAAVMVAAQQLGASRAVLLKYLNSGDVTGDRSSVVGYASAALLRT
jgi:AmmeMemoRadiSam system protein B